MAYDLFVGKTSTVPPHPTVGLLVRDGQGRQARHDFKSRAEVLAFLQRLGGLVDEINAWQEQGRRLDKSHEALDTARKDEE